YGTLPALPDRLGTGYSANGDYLGFAFDTDQPFEPGVGPTITTNMVFDRGTGGNRRWFLFQEGGVPRQVVSLLQLLEDDRFGGLLRVPHDLAEHLKQAARERIGAAGGEAKDDLAIFLAMGRDTADGTIELLPVTRDLRVIWNTTANLPLYETQERFCEDVARALGGHAASNPLWRRFRIPVSVHNLGGCPMADDPADGVTDGTGQVHGYPGLYVLDGACLPSATGVNPSHTIAAVAERNIEAAIRKITGKANWVAPERALAAPVHEPLGAVTIPSGGTPEVATPGVGLTFTETMCGFLRRHHQPAADFHGAATAGRRMGTAASFTLDVTSPFLAQFLADEAHQMTAEGIVHVDGVTGPDGARVGNGVVNLLVAGERPTSRWMLYTLPFVGADGQPYLLEGYKDVRDHGSFDVWGATTTLYTYLRHGHAPGGEVLSTGILHLPLPAFIRQLATAQVTGTHNPLRQAEALARFGQFFLGSLVAVFLAPRLPFSHVIFRGSDVPASRVATSRVPASPGRGPGSPDEAVTDPRGRRDQSGVSGRRAAGVAGRGRSDVRPR
ncbi:MAG: GMC family oxidoreductase, partial [Pseudonocardiaceae bacterium]